MNVDRWKESLRVSNANRRARKLKACVADQPVTGSVLAKLRRETTTCYICNKPITPSDAGHFDHMWPLSRGGPHVRWNLAWVHAGCNISKGAKLPIVRAILP